MNITPLEFLSLINEGKTELELNLKSSNYVDPKELKSLTSTKYGHSIISATKHLLTDYSNGYTICKGCGSFYQLGKGFTKHLSMGCLKCEGEAKHRVYHVDASKPSEGGFPSRYMSQMFDDGLHYCEAKLQVGLFKKEVNSMVK